MGMLQLSKEKISCFVLGKTCKLKRDPRIRYTITDSTPKCLQLLICLVEQIVGMSVTLNSQKLFQLPCIVSQVHVSAEESSIIRRREMLESSSILISLLQCSVVFNLNRVFSLFQDHCLERHFCQKPLPFIENIKSINLCNFQVPVDAGQYVAHRELVRQLLNLLRCKSFKKPA